MNGLWLFAAFEVGFLAGVAVMCLLSVAGDDQ